MTDEREGAPRETGTSEPEPIDPTGDGTAPEPSDEAGDFAGPEADTDETTVARPAVAAAAAEPEAAALGEPRGPALALGEPLTPGDALVDPAGDADTLASGVDVAAGASTPPLPRRRALRRISAKTPTVTATNTREARSSMCTIRSDGVGAAAAGLPRAARRSPGRIERPGTAASGSAAAAGTAGRATVVSSVSASGPAKSPASSEGSGAVPSPVG
ncbi:MAG: hypothetical protein H0V87_04875, partial [Chloroflexi bacterium]|nr:hypothetical protein [Chloroflexota bacterium]